MRLTLTPEETRWLLYAVNSVAAAEAAWPSDDGRGEAFREILRKIREGDADDLAVSDDSAFAQ